jgi:hypothetical protein
VAAECRQAETETEAETADALAPGLQRREDMKLHVVMLWFRFTTPSTARAEEAAHGLVLTGRVQLDFDQLIAGDDDGAVAHA